MEKHEVGAPKIIACLLGLTVLALIIYGQTLGFDYVWDDGLLFLDKTALVNEPLSWQLLSEPVLPGTTYFRPLVFLTLFAEFHIFGQNPATSHAINVLILIINIWLIFFVCLNLAQSHSGQQPILTALLAGLLYATHPALTESTSWVSGRFDSLCTLFILLASLIYVCQIRPWIKISLITICFLGALFSKELGAMLIPVILCLWLSKYNPKENGFWRSLKHMLTKNSFLLITMLLAFAAYVALRQQAMSNIYHNSLNAEYIKLAWLNLLPLEALRFYTIQILVPFGNMNPLHPMERGSNFALDALSAVFLFLFFVYVCMRRTPAAWLVMAALALLVPVLHIIPITIMDNIGHERFLTAPLAFLAIGISLFLCKLAVKKTDTLVKNSALYTVIIGWLIISTWNSYISAASWRNELTLWNWALHKSPQSEFARYNYIYGALKMSRSDLVEKEISRQLEEDGALSVANQILYANMLIRKGNIEGMRYLEGVLYALPKFHLMPDGKKLINNFTMSAMQMGGAYHDYANALMVFKGNAEEALKYSQYAEFYLQPSQKMPLLYTRIAILHALERHDDALAIEKALEPLYHSNKESYKTAKQQILTIYCKAKPESDKTCIQLKSMNLTE